MTGHLFQLFVSTSVIEFDHGITEATNLPYRSNRSTRLFGWVTVRVGDCSSGRLFDWATVRVGDCSSGRLFGWATVRVGEWATVRVADCSGGRLFEWATVRVGDCSTGRLLKHVVASDTADGLFEWATVRVGDCSSGRLFEWVTVRLGVIFSLPLVSKAPYSAFRYLGISTQHHYHLRILSFRPSPDVCSPSLPWRPLFRPPPFQSWTRLQDA